jgi:hypothetical protein
MQPRRNGADTDDPEYYNRRGRPLTSQAIGMLLRNQLYAGIVDVPEYGVRGRRGDFEPLISEELFYGAQAVPSGRVPSTTPKQRAHPDFPLRGFVRCESCGRGLTGSWSKGRSEHDRWMVALRINGLRPACTAMPGRIRSSMDSEQWRRSESQRSTYANSGFSGVTTRTACKFDPPAGYFGLSRKPLLSNSAMRLES